MADFSGNALTSASFACATERNSASSHVLVKEEWDRIIAASTIHVHVEDDIYLNGDWLLTFRLDLDDFGLRLRCEEVRQEAG